MALVSDASRRKAQSSRTKSMKPCSTWVDTSFTFSASPTRRPHVPAHQLAFGRRRENAHPCALGAGAGDQRIEALAHARLQQQRGLGLAQLPLHLLCGIFLAGAMLRQLAQLGVRIGLRLIRQRGLEQAQCDQVRETAVGRGGVGVVAHRQSEMADGRAAGHFDHVLATAHELDDDQGEVGKAQRVEPVLLRQKGLQRLGVRLVRQDLAVVLRHPHDAQPALGRAHHPAQRGAALCGQVARGAAVGGDHHLLDQLARAVLHLLADVHDLLALEQRPRLEGLQVQRAQGMAACAQLLGQGVLGAQLGLHAGHRGGGIGQVSLAVDPGTHRVVGQLGPVVHPCARYTVEPASEASALNTISVTRASRSWAGFSEVRSVHSRSGSIGKMRAEV
jgi:hypothetical protein